MPEREPELFTISEDNNGIPLLSETNQGTMKNGGKTFASTLGDNNEGIPYCKECSSVEPLPIIKIDLNNNKYIDLERAFNTDCQVHMRKQSLTASESAHQEPACLPPTYVIDHVVGCHHVSSSHVTVSGADVSDIPTSYAIPKLAPYEKAVVGTFVDLMITPGYPYKVRLNGTDDFLFDGKPLTLKSVGQGYGKRLMFDSDDILNNGNYFWSDSNPRDGFALSLCIDIAGEFLIKSTDGYTFGKSAVTFVSDHQVVKRIRCRKGSAVELEVKVKFTCDLSINDPQSILSADTTLEGVAIATRAKDGVEVSRIEDVSVPGCGECVFEKTDD